MVFVDKTWAVNTIKKRSFPLVACLLLCQKNVYYDITFKTWKGSVVTAAAGRFEKP